MTVASKEQAYFTFSRGINTDASALTFPENFSLDEQNFELMIDGSRRRRRGLQLETDGEAVNHPTWDTSYIVRAHKWHEVGGDPDVNFVVMQVGEVVYFFDDNVEPVSPTLKGFSIDLTNYKVAGATTALLGTNQIDVAYGRGFLFIVHKYIKPIWIEYDATADELTVNLITIKERDFQGIDDGTDVSVEPATLSDDHRYNLLNRGWQSADITSYFSSQSKYPSKAMVPALGYRRVSTSGVAEVDWSKEFSPAKLVSELFQDVSAPTGHFVIDPFTPDTTVTPTSTIAISTWTTSTTTPSATATITVTTDSAHGLSPTDTVYITGNAGYYYAGVYLVIPFSLNGTYTVATTPDTDEFTFTLTWPSNFISWVSQYYQKGSVYSDAALNASENNSSVRPTTVEFFAGRAWYAGTPFRKLSSKIYFSQVIESDAQHGKCYQAADPTDQRISDLVDTDGGVITIPEATQVHQILAYSGVLLVFAQSGIWEIGGGPTGYFTATGFRVRKISDIGSMGAGSVVVAENIPFFWGQGGIYQITQDPNSGYLTVQNVSYNRINNLYTSFTTDAKYNAQGVYDDVNKRIVWLHQGTATGSNAYNRALLFDLRFQSFYTFTFGADLHGVFTLRNADVRGKVKWIRCEDDGDILISDLESLDFKDYAGNEESAYLVTGYEVLGDPSRWKYAPVIHVYHKRTETGYTDTGVGFDPVNPGSCLLQARFDWTDNSTPNKWGNEYETYRHRRMFVPSAEDDTSGYPIIVSRNKLRGRGRSVHLKFTAGTGKDTQLLGWQIKYDVLTAN